MSVDHRLETIQQENTRHTTDHRQVSFGLRQPSFLPVPSGLLQRKCACGGTPGVDGECAECRAKRLGSQRQVNDQAMPPIVHEVLRSPGQPLDASTRAFMEPRFGHDFSQVRVHTGAPQGLRASLTVNQPGDEYEQEADRVAEQIMRMPEPHASLREQTYSTQPIMHLSPLTPGPSPIWGENSGVPPVVYDVLCSSGQPLDVATRAFFEPRFGHDFGEVRVHTDAKAAESAHAVNALAYTTGTHIVFGAGGLAGSGPDRERLLAHELAHVVQQGLRASPALQRQAAQQSTCSGTVYDPLTQCCCDKSVITTPCDENQYGCFNFTSRDIEYDGCSVPEALKTPDQADNPGGANDTWLTDRSIHGTRPRDFVPKLPCDVHDKCYQTCHRFRQDSDRHSCDEALITGAQAVCDNAADPTARKDCNEAVKLAESTIKSPVTERAFINAFNQRQSEYCACCLSPTSPGPQPAPQPAPPAKQPAVP
jgi:hypothetical protein